MFRILEVREVNFWYPVWLRKIITAIIFADIPTYMIRIGHGEEVKE